MPDTDTPPRRAVQGRKPRQLPTAKTSVEEIMRTTAFRQGVSDARAGRRPRFDGEFIDASTTDVDFANAQWAYERGRLFGTIAPHNLLVVTKDQRLNPKAARLYRYSIGKIL